MNGGYEMSYLGERVAYLRGLSEGLDSSEQTAEGKLLLKMIEVLEDVADSINEIEQTQDEMDEYIQDIDEDLGEVEEELFGCDCCDEDDDEDFLEVECPHCHEVIYFDADSLADDELICPVCKQSIITDEEAEPSDEE